MSDPTIVCPHCRTEIKLNESLAAPLLESTRIEFEKRLAAKEADVAVREQKLAASAAAMEEQVAAKVKSERDKIAADEARKAKTGGGGRSGTEKPVNWPRCRKC